MSLTKYKQKRNLKISKEPLPRKQMERKKSSLKKPIYVIHEHHASHLHFDFRLEMNGVLKSWAVPKSPPETKNVKRLAIEVEDHPLDYASFQGIIPEGNYGAGEVKIWDKGNYKLIKKTPGKIIFELSGKKLRGKYCLVKTNYGGNRKNWLWFKI